MNQEEKIIFEILENLIILFQNHLPSKILKTEEFQQIKKKMETLRDRK
jgi:hypothetical protein